MSGRLKSLLVVLVAGAGLSLWYALYPSSALPDSAGTATLSDQVGSGPCSDQDSDGLCDYDETYWGTSFSDADSDDDGFKDGEEVLSGHDPARAGPDDLLNGRENLTQKAAGLIYGAMLTGDLDTNSAAYEESVQALVDATLNQVDSNTAVELDSIVVASSSTDAFIRYMSATAKLLGQMMPEIQANEGAFMETIRGIEVADLPKLGEVNPGAYKAYLRAADNEIAAFDSRVNAVKSLRVPSKLVGFQKSLITYLRGMQQQYRLARTITHDPVQALLSLQVLNVLAIQTGTEITESFTRQAANAFP